MENLEQELKKDAAKAIDVLKAGSKKPQDIEKIVKEYKAIDRTIRLTQVGNIQKDKTIGKGEKAKLVPGVRIPVHFQKKIVETSVAFEVGEPSTLIPSVKNQLSELIAKLWKTNRLDSKIQKIKLLQKSQTEGAVQFYMKDIEEGSLFLKMLSLIGIKDQKKEIKCNILDNTKGTMSPYFDAFGDMVAFVWVFIVKDSEGKDVKNAWIYDDANVYKCDEGKGNMSWVSTEKHGFSKIPIVYIAQDNPEYFDVQAMIDRYEVTLSKLGASNDYSGHPMLKIFGKVENAPDKDEDGKAWIIPVSVDDEGNEVKGDVEFLNNENAGESVALELEKLEDLIWAISSTPNLSLNNLKDLGALSGIAIKLLFLEPILKAKLSEGDNRTMYERILNVIISGIVTTTNIKLSNEAQQLFYDVQFNSILPDDLKSTVETLVSGVSGGIISAETAVGVLDMTVDAEEEIARIQKALEKNNSDVPEVKE